MFMGKMKKAVDQNKKAEKAKMKKYATKKPYLILGFGITAFFDLIRVFVYLFIVLTILAIPALIIFNAQRGVEGLRSFYYGRFSMGNLGYSSTYCFSSSVGQENMLLRCQGGSMTGLSELKQDEGPVIKGYGLIKSTEEDLQYCLADQNVVGISECDG